jgi:DnaJ-class molecular chaperone
MTASSYLLFKFSPVLTSKHVLVIIKRSSSSSSSSPLSHYEILKVSKSASHGEIKEAYIAMCKEFHPDKNPSPDANLQFR